MKAIGYTERGPISGESAVIEFETNKPIPGQKDLLVEVRGISLNDHRLKTVGLFAVLKVPFTG